MQTYPYTAQIIWFYYCPRSKYWLNFFQYKGINGSQNQLQKPFLTALMVFNRKSSSLNGILLENSDSFFRCYNRKKTGESLTLVYLKNTGDHFLRNYIPNACKIVIFPVEISHSKQHRLKRKNYPSWKKIHYLQGSYKNLTKNTFLARILQGNVFLERILQEPCKWCRALARILQETHFYWSL